MKVNSVWLSLLALGLGSCDLGGAKGEFTRQLEICAVAERNGLLEAAVEACGAALAIAEEQAYGPEQISRLLYRLAQFERQRGEFARAQALAERSLTLEEQRGERGELASRLIELALTAAGQNRWTDGAELLERAAPVAGELSGEERMTAANTFRAFGARMDALGQTALAERFRAMAQALAEDPR